MAKVVVLGGAGGMGSVAVKDLALNGYFEEIVIADANETRALEIASEISSENISVAKVNVEDVEQLVNVISDASVVINFVGPFYRYASTIIRAAIKAEVHYVDICDDYDSTELMLKMCDEVKKSGITVLTGMGSSPGMTNIIARMGMNELDVTEEIDTIWVMGESETGSAVLYHILHSGSDMIPGYEQGERRKIKPFSEEGSLKVGFPRPLGKVKVYDIGHPEPITIPHFFS